MNSTLITPRYYAGFGCRRGCSESALRELLEQALRAQHLTIEQLDSIASIDHKQSEPGLHALAQRLNKPLIFFTAQQLTLFNDRLDEPSALVAQITGAGSVAAASALALAESRSAQRAELIIAKRKSASATFALACVPLSNQRGQR